MFFAKSYLHYMFIMRHSQYTYSYFELFSQNDASFLHPFSRFCCPENLSSIYPKLQKTLENTNLPGFSRVLNKFFFMSLLSHLLCNLCCKIFFFLFDSLSGFETNKSLNCNVSTVFFSCLCYILCNC